MKQSKLEKIQKEIDASKKALSDFTKTLAKRKAQLEGAISEGQQLALILAIQMFSELVEKQKQEIKELKAKKAKLEKDLL